MVVTDQMIAILFKFLNFTLLLCLIIYGIKRYFLPTLRKQMESYRAYLETLRSSHRSLKKDERMLQKDMIEEEAQQMQLKENVKRWHKVAAEHRDELLRERDNRKELLLKRFEKHKDQIALYRTYKQVVPEAIEQARHALEKRFASGDEQQKFIKKIMSDLRKK